MSALPALTDRTTMITTLAEQLYGVLDLDAHVAVTSTDTDERAVAGKADHHDISLEVAGSTWSHRLPVTLTIPRGAESPATVLLVNFGALPHPYCPLEELIDAGVAVAVLNYADVTSDNDDFGDGLAALVPRQGAHPWGKIALWAWAASRVLDHLLVRDDLDPTRIWVAGHSRLGKTALWAAAQDERFAGAISNNSGCAGAALFRGNVGEQLSDITDNFPYWFTPALVDHQPSAEELPFDQHWLLAAISPRRVCVGSADDDVWADPAREEQACLAALPAWTERDLPETSVQYHRRPGTHYLSRDDWAHYLRAVTQQ